MTEQPDGPAAHEVPSPGAPPQDEPSREAPSQDEPSADAPTPRSERGGLIVLVVAGVIFAAIVGGYFVWRFGSTRTAPPQPAASAAVTTATPSAGPLPAGTEAVPNVVGMSQSTAEAALNNHGFLPLATYVTTTTATSGDVIVQTPAAGAGLKKGSQVAFVVARSAPLSAEGPAPLPNVYQMPWPQAQSLLMSFGFDPVRAVAPSTDASGLAFEQAPVAGVEEVPGTPVLVVLSNGTAPKTASVKIPDVVGKTESDAAKALANVGLASQTIRTFADAAGGHVVRQLPQAGGTIGPGAPIALDVSLGPLPSGESEIAVPDLKNMDAATAVQALWRAGLFAEVAQVSDAKSAPDTVAGQVPPAAWMVPVATVAIVSVEQPSVAP